MRDFTISLSVFDALIALESWLITKTFCHEYFRSTAILLMQRDATEKIIFITKFDGQL